MGVVGQYMGYLAFWKRKQAYMGRPASAMRWDEDKGRYIIDGDSDSDDEPVAPPPKITAKPKVEEERKKPQEEVKEVSGANAFAK